MQQTQKNKNWFFKFLNFVETTGNKLPNPAVLFALMAVGVVVLSWVAATMGLKAIDPATNTAILPANLVSIQGLNFILTKTVTNFTSFAPLGMVLVALMGLGVAEHSGFITTAVRKLVMSTPKRFVTASLFLAAILMHTASDAGYVVLIPLGGVIFLAVGRNPIAGLAAAFAGVSGGFCANFLLGSGDAMLAAISQEAARILPSFAHYEVSPTCNYFFMAVSGIMVITIGTLVNDKLVEPRLGKYLGEEKPQELGALTKEESRGLRWGLIALAIIAALCLWGLLPADGFLRDAKGGILHSPLLKGIVTLIFLAGAASGIAYGYGAGTFKSTNDIIKSMGKSMSTLGSYIVLVFFAAQFVALFKESNLGTIIAILGADFLRDIGLKSIPLLVGLIALTAVINLFIGSASAKWALMAPVFVPMFMLLGYTPEATQAAYRIGDSVTNIISPLFPYAPLLIAYFGKYDKKAGLGTIIAAMLPYSIVFGIFWTALFIAWLYLGLPFGPGVAVNLPA